MDEKEVKVLLKERNTAFRSGDEAQYRAAWANLRRGIREAKTAYKRRNEDHFSSNNIRQVWQGVQSITNYRSNNLNATNGDVSLAEELNHFFARFEVGTPAALRPHSPAPSSHILTVQAQEVRCALQAVNPRKAAGPDGVTGRVLRDCADQLADVFTDIFNQSLSQCLIPACLKSSTIIPLPKKTNASTPNDYRPVALTPIIMKCFEKLVWSHITASLPPTFDPHQFTYRANRSTEDAIATALHTTLTHVEQKGSYARLLFVDFSSAFNTIMPSRLVTKLLDLGFSQHTSSWIITSWQSAPRRWE